LFPGNLIQKGHAVLLFTIIAGLVMAAIGYHVAGRKGKNTTLWTVLCFFFGVIPLIVLLCKKPEPAVVEAQGIQTN
jgi:hypothetical protein